MTVKRVIIVLFVLAVLAGVVASASAGRDDGKYDPTPIQYQLMPVINGAEPAECAGQPGCRTICFTTNIYGDIDIDCEPYLVQE